MASSRIAMLYVLTACMYAFSMFMQRDLWLFPFPLFRMAFPFVMLAMLVADRSKWNKLDGVMLLWGTLLLASSNYTLQLFFSEHYFLTHKSIFGWYSSIVLLLFALVFFTWQLAISWKSKRVWRITQWIGASGFLACMLINDFRLAIVPITLWFIAVMRSPEIPRRYHSIALVFWFVVCAVTISGWYFGQDEVLAFL